MLTLKLISEETERVVKGLEKKHFNGAREAIEKVLELDKQRRDAQQKLDVNKQQQNQLSKQIGALMGQGKKAEAEEVKAQGYKPGVYASTLWYRKRIDLNSLKKYTIWNAHYGVASSPIDCDMWQGTEKARINGYSGELDANISYMG